MRASSSSSSSSLIELDTAIAYAGGNTEEILGRIFSRMPKEKLSKISVATKGESVGEKMASVAGGRRITIGENFARRSEEFNGTRSKKYRYFVLTRSRFGDDFIRGARDRSRVVSFRSV